MVVPKSRLLPRSGGRSSSARRHQVDTQRESAACPGKTVPAITRTVQGSDQGVRLQLHDLNRSWWPRAGPDSVLWTLVARRQTQDQEGAMEQPEVPSVESSQVIVVLATTRGGHGHLARRRARSEFGRGAGAGDRPRPWTPGVGSSSTSAMSSSWTARPSTRSWRPGCASGRTAGRLASVTRRPRPLPAGDLRPDPPGRDLTSTGRRRERILRHLLDGASGEVATDRLCA